MKKATLLFAMLFASLSALASECKDLVARFSQDDRIETIYQCKLVSTEVGNPSYSYEKMCFSSAKTWNSEFRDTSYRTYRYGQNGNDDYADVMILNQNPNGLIRGGYAIQKGPVLNLSDDGQISGTTGQRWIEETQIDFSSQQIIFNTYDKGLFKKTLSSSARYQCEKVQ
jgi:hypothetical protein